MQYAFKKQIGQTKKHEDKREGSRSPNVDQYQFPPKDIHNIGKRLGYEN